MMSLELREPTALELAVVVEAQAADLAALRQELEETNRGVVALYAELDDKFRALYAKAPGGICLLDASGRIVDANPALPDDNAGFGGVDDHACLIGAALDLNLTD